MAMVSFATRQRHDVGRAEGGGIGEAHVEVVEELWSPPRGATDGSAAREGHVGELGSATPGLGAPASNSQ